VERNSCNRTSFFLDISLPRLNEMTAARRIRKVPPESKIIFVSQEFDPDVVEEAFNIGAWAYIVKTQAGTDLLAAVDAVVEGGQFVSHVLSGKGPRPSVATRQPLVAAPAP
jgi:DNA-binding NarL/FixJ family response regulator